jgi:hypothetical protein
MRPSHRIAVAPPVVRQSETKPTAIVVAPRKPFKATRSNVPAHGKPPIVNASLKAPEPIPAVRVLVPQTPSSPPESFWCHLEAIGSNCDCKFSGDERANNVLQSSVAHSSLAADRTGQVRFLFTDNAPEPFCLSRKAVPNGATCCKLRRSGLPPPSLKFRFPRFRLIVFPTCGSLHTIVGKPFCRLLSSLFPSGFNKEVLLVAGTPGASCKAISAAEEWLFFRKGKLCSDPCDCSA